MAIACETCTQPVHEDVVVCPHCGGPSGATPDLTPLEAAELASDRPPGSLPMFGVEDLGSGFSILESGAAVVELGYELVSAVIAAADVLGDHDPPLPTAIARVRPRQLTPLKTVEPAKVEPADPSAPPRFLK
ncbi:hypothetical protein BH11MYX1_BH11MYX1_08040 [soil metagenome]